VISSSQRPLPDNKQHSQQTNIHAFGGFELKISAGERPQTHALRPRGYWDGQVYSADNERNLFITELEGSSPGSRIPLLALVLSSAAYLLIKDSPGVNT
jgi:hypothetical protein